MVDYLGHLGFFVMAMAYWVKDLLLLRLIALLGFSTLIFFNFFVGTEPNWIAVGWNGFFILINGFQAGKMIYQRSQLVLNEREKEIYDRLFSDLSEFEFAKLIRLAQWQLFEQGTQLIKEGQQMTQLFFVYNGTVGIYSEDRKLTDLKDGHFVGEMSFLSRNPASADAKALTDCQVCTWDQEGLRALLHRSPSLFFCIQSRMGKQLSEAVKTTNQSMAS